jgi:uncharacterized membrane protein
VLEVKFTFIAGNYGCQLTANHKEGNMDTPAYKLRTFGFPGAASSFARGINNRGQILGFYSLTDPAAYAGSFGGVRGFLLSQGVFTTIDVPGATLTLPIAINDAEEIVGHCHYQDGRGSLCFRRVRGNFVNFSIPNSSQTYVRDLDAAGHILGQYFDNAGKSHGYVLMGDGHFDEIAFDEIAFPNATITVPTGMYDLQTIVGSYTKQEITPPQPFWEGFLLKGGNYTPFNVPGALGTRPQAVNVNGDILGLYTDSANSDHIFVYSGGNFATIDFPGVELSVYSMNESGQFVGGTVDHGGNLGFLATPDRPLPDALKPKIRDGILDHATAMG